MSKQEYDNQVITEYLLGSLPEAEAEYFDELSFTDNEFADALKSAEKDLVDSYVQGELVGATLKKFKSFYLASPIRRQKVEFASVFQVIAEKNIAQTNEAIPIVAKTKQTKTIADFFSALNIFGSSRPVLKWSFAAATLAFVFLAGWLWVASTRLNQQQANETIVKQHDLPTEREQDKQIQPKIPRATDKEKELAQGSEERERREQALKKDQAIKQQRIAEQLRRSKQQQQSSPPTIASFILLPPMRDSNSIPNLAIPARTDYVQMRLQLESDDYSAYRVALVAAQSDDKKLWLSGKLKTSGKGENKVLKIRFPANFLKSQVYSLVVSGIKTDGEVEIISNYPFRAVLR